MEGSLNKWTNVMKGWQSRYFVLDDRKGSLTYYTSKEKMTRGVSRGIVNLKGAVVTIAGCEEAAFTIRVGSRTYHLMAKDEAERDLWVSKLEELLPRLQDMSDTEQKLRSEKSRDSTDADSDSKSKYPIITTSKGSSEKSKMSIPKSRSIEKQSLPTISYPSSGDDDDYFDAAEATSAEMDTTSMSIVNQVSAPSASEQRFRSCSDLSIFLKSDGTLDYDKMYEDSMESELSLENHGSIITHLISQVRVGMDLTKVTLPIFILERRSLLEMYADSFAHPDMFLSIPEMTSERDRMVQVVKWYLCSYHAGRKSKAPKKPYNPILGEVFQCYWETETRSDDEYIEQGPVPWCKGHHLSFIAEQVSHHPPISAFYAEHYNKKITFSAHVWTKSKFLGLSIGVHNIGFGTVHLIDHDERYVLTFPNGYGRSILTAPWIELGGNVEIKCEKTGYRAAIEFLTKPFYGGKKHRISGEVFDPQSKKPFLTISGEWNNVMTCKWSNGVSEVFADVNTLNAVKKVVRPIVVQEDNESRKVWKEVTAGLRLNDVNYATKAKNEIEENQRAKAMDMKRLGVVWENKYFEPDGSEKWQYKYPLKDRLEIRS